MQFRINEYGTLKVVSADKLSPVESLKECHLERDGDVEMVPTNKDNPSVAQGEGASLAGVQRTGFCELTMESACSHGSFQLLPSSLLRSPKNRCLDSWELNGQNTIENSRQLSKWELDSVALYLSPCTNGAYCIYRNSAFRRVRGDIFKPAPYVLLHLFMGPRRTRFLEVSGGFLENEEVGNI